MLPSFQEDSPTPPRLGRLKQALGFETSAETFLWTFFAATLAPLSMVLRFWFWKNPLLSPDAVAQTRTALTVHALHSGKAGLLDYPGRGPGLPLYEWICARLLDMGFSVEYAGRFVTMLCFLATAVALGRLAARLLGKRAAAWTTLLWLISPLTIQYSRAVVVEFAALFLTLSCAGLFLEVLARDRALGWGTFAAVALGSSAAGLIKFPLWAGPAVAQILYLFRDAVHLGRFPRRHRAMALALLFPAAISLIWIWRRGAPLSAEALGMGGNRLDWHLWKALLLSAGNSVFQGWMAIPFVLVFPLGRKERRPAVIALALLAFVPMGVFFSGHLESESWLVGEAAFLIAVAACGMETLFSLPPTLRGAWIGIGAALLTWHLAHFYDTFGGLDHDYGENLATARQLKALTAPDDLVYYGGPSKDFHLALYSNRRVENHAPIDRTPAASDTDLARELASVFLFDRDGPDLDRLASFDPIWIVSTPELSLYRVAKRGAFDFDRSKFIGVGSYSARMPDYFFDAEGTLSLRARPHPSSFLVVELVRPGRSVTVKAVGAGLTYSLPRKEYVFLPAPPAEEPETYEITLVP